jgi:hypothetical protein
MSKGASLNLMVENLEDEDDDNEEQVSPDLARRKKSVIRGR